MKRWMRLVALLAIELVLLASAYGRHAALERQSLALSLPFHDYWVGRDFGGGYAELAFDLDWPRPHPDGSDLGEWGLCWAIFEESTPTWRLTDVQSRKAGDHSPILAAGRIAIEGSYGGTSVSLAGVRRVRVDDAEFAELKALRDRASDPNAPREIEQGKSRPHFAPRADSTAMLDSLRAGTVEARVVGGRILSLRRMAVDGRELAR